MSPFLGFRISQCHIPGLVPSDEYSGKNLGGGGGVGGRGRQNSAFLFNTDVCAMYSFEKQNFSNY